MNVEIGNEARQFASNFRLLGGGGGDQNWGEIGLYVNIVYGNLKSENSQDYAQKPQQNCTFMNSASGDMLVFGVIKVLIPLLHFCGTGKDL